MNNIILESLCSICDTYFDQAMLVVHRCGQQAGLAMCDIKSAFCLLPAHPANFELLGFMLEGQFYMIKVFAMCCLVSCATFKWFTSLFQ